MGKNLLAVLSVALSVGMYASMNFDDFNFDGDIAKELDYENPRDGSEAVLDRSDSVPDKSVPALNPSNPVPSGSNRMPDRSKFTELYAPSAYEITLSKNNGSKITEWDKYFNIYCETIHTRCVAFSSYYKNEGDKGSEYTGSICAYNSKNGFINFKHPCDIAYKNCLINNKKRQSSSLSRSPILNSKDIFFYNGKDKPCEYYLKDGIKLEDAVKSYHQDETKIKYEKEDFGKQPPRPQRRFFSSRFTTPMVPVDHKHTLDILYQKIRRLMYTT